MAELARRLRRAADESIAGHEDLVRMVRAWERGDHCPSERYELLYRRLGLLPGNENGAQSQPPTRSTEGIEPVRRRTFVELTGIDQSADVRSDSQVSTRPHRRRYAGFRCCAYDDLRNARWDRAVSTRTSTEESWINLADWHKAENSRQTLA